MRGPVGITDLHLIPPSTSDAIAFIYLPQETSGPGTVAVLIGRGRRMPMGNFGIELSMSRGMDYSDDRESDDGNPLLFVVPTASARPGQKAGRPIKVWAGYHADDIGTGDLRVTIEAPAGYRVEWQDPVTPFAMGA